MGIYSLIIIFTLIFFIFDSSISLNFTPHVYNQLGLALILISFLYSTIGLIKINNGPKIHPITIYLKNLPSEFENFKIIQLSDVHIGPTLKSNFVSKIVKLCNLQNPDLVVLTGDMTDGTPLQLKDEMLGFTKINAKFGKFMALGNHEYYWGISKWIKFWNEIGYKTLINEHTIINKNGQSLLLAGVHDYSAHRISKNYVSDPGVALLNAPKNLISILLAHQPKSIYKASQYGYHLQLSGHTHAGQYFPFNLLIYLFQPFVKGLKKYKNTQLYINQGTGHWGPQNRIGTSLEISLITLKSDIAK